jgi:hypothetical protein
MLRYLYQQKKERGWQMSANVYSIENLLVGKMYYSKTTQGEIISAEKHPSPIWYENCETYLVEIAPNSGSNTWGRRTYRTVAVKTGE